MKTKKIFLILLPFTFYLFTLLGCTAISGGTKKDVKSEGMRSLEAQDNSKLNDIPVPRGFKFLAQESYFFESSGIRVAVLKYQGKADVEQVTNFYKSQMPMYNWELLNIMEYGNLLMNFDRNLETCIINLSPKFNGVLISISLGPKSQSPKKSEKPVK